MKLLTLLLLLCTLAFCACNSASGSKPEPLKEKSYEYNIISGNTSYRGIVSYITDSSGCLKFTVPKTRCGNPEKEVKICGGAIIEKVEKY